MQQFELFVVLCSVSEMSSNSLNRSMRKGFGDRDRVVFGLSQWAGSTAPFFSATRWPTIAAVGAAFLDSAGEAWQLTDPELMQLY